MPVDHACRTNTGADEINEWMWRNCGMKFVVGENRRNPEKNLPRTRFIHHETNMKWPRLEIGTPAVGGGRLTAWVTGPPQISTGGVFEIRERYRYRAEEILNVPTTDMIQNAL